MPDIHERLTMAREKAGYTTAASAARALNAKPQTYYAHENGNSGIRTSVAQKYARKFKVSLEWLVTGRGEMSTDTVVPFDNDIEGLPLLGFIQAGHWIEADDQANEGAIRMVPVERDQRFPYARQYALKVVGDSMDLDYPDGSVVVCVSFADSGLALAEGMVVHVERHRAGGQLVEVTLKMVERRKGELCLVPHSTNPKHQAFPLKSQDPETEVLAKGIVISGQIPRQLPKP